MVTRAERRISRAWKAGIILAALVSLGTLTADLRDLRGVPNATDILVDDLIFVGIIAGVYAVLAFGVLKKNRLTSILLVAFLLFNAVFFFMFPTEIGNEGERMLATVNEPFEIIEVAIFGYFFFNGIRGTFEYHRLKNSRTESYPDDVMNCYNMSIIYRESKDYEKALKYCDAALKIKHKMSYAWQNKGILLDKLDRKDEAIACLDLCIELNPRNWHAAYTKGLLLLKLEKYLEAVKCFDDLLSKRPDLGEALFQRARANTMIGAHEQALDDLKRAFEIDKNHYFGLSQNDPALSVLKNQERFQALTSIP